MPFDLILRMFVAPFFDLGDQALADVEVLLVQVHRLGVLSFVASARGTPVPDISREGTYGAVAKFGRDVVHEQAQASALQHPRRGALFAPVDEHERVVAGKAGEHRAHGLLVPAHLDGVLMDAFEALICRMTDR